jgi:hypothetical protein
MHPPSKWSVLAVLLLGASALAACAEGQRWGYRPYRYSRCAAIEDRIDRDRDKIDQIEPTGRHRDALRWYREDLADARRDLDYCRYGS